MAGFAAPTPDQVLAAVWTRADITQHSRCAYFLQAAGLRFARVPLERGPRLLCVVGIGAAPDTLLLFDFTLLRACVVPVANVSSKPATPDEARDVIAQMARAYACHRFEVGTAIVSTELCLCFDSEPICSLPFLHMHDSSGNLTLKVTRTSAATSLETTAHVLPFPPPCVHVISALMKHSERLLADQRAGLACAHPCAAGGMSWELYASRSVSDTSAVAASSARPCGAYVLLRSWLIQGTLQQQLLREEVQKAPAEAEGEAEAHPVSGPSSSASGVGLKRCRPAGLTVVASEKVIDARELGGASGVSVYVKACLAGDDFEGPAAGDASPGWAARLGDPIRGGGRGIDNAGTGAGPGRFPERIAGQYRFLLQASQRAPSAGKGSHLGIPFVECDPMLDEYRPEVTAWRWVCGMLESSLPSRTIGGPPAVSLQGFMSCILAQSDAGADDESVAGVDATRGPGLSHAGLPSSSSVASDNACPTHRPVGTAVSNAIPSAALGSRWHIDGSRDVQCGGREDGRAVHIAAAAAQGTSSRVPSPSQSGVRTMPSSLPLFVVDADALAITVGRERNSAMAASKETVSPATVVLGPPLHVLSLDGAQCRHRPTRDKPYSTLRVLQRSAIGAGSSWKDAVGLFVNECFSSLGDNRTGFWLAEDEVAALTLAAGAGAASCTVPFPPSPQTSPEKVVVLHHPLPGFLPTHSACASHHAHPVDTPTSDALAICGAWRCFLQGEHVPEAGSIVLRYPPLDVATARILRNASGLSGTRGDVGGSAVREPAAASAAVLLTGTSHALPPLVDGCDLHGPSPPLPGADTLPGALDLCSQLAAADAPMLVPRAAASSAAAGVGSSPADARAAMLACHSERCGWPLVLASSASSSVRPSALFFSAWLPALCSRYGVPAAAAADIAPAALCSGWLRCVFPHRTAAFQTLLYHGTGPGMAERVAAEGFRRPLCRRLPGACPTSAGAADGSDAAAVDDACAHPIAGFGSGGGGGKGGSAGDAAAAAAARRHSTLPSVCTCGLPACGHRCQCQMEGFGVYLADRPDKADHFAVNRSEWREKGHEEGGGAMVGGRIMACVDLGHVKAAGDCPCPCGCGKGFVDHPGYWYAVQGYDTLLVRDASLPATRHREWAVADPLRVDIVRLTYVRARVA